jgi:hypothetical protein
MPAAVAVLDITQVHKEPAVLVVVSAVRIMAKVLLQQPRQILVAVEVVAVEVVEVL